MDTVIQALGSQSFIQSFLVLLATAIVTGLLVPFVKANMDERKLRQQKLFEMDLARQNEVIKAQVALLENLAQMIWDFKLMAFEVSYNKLYGQNQAKYEASLKKYDEASWGFFSKIRAEISKARRFTSDEIYQKLLEFYKQDLMNGDGALMNLVGSNATLEKWQERHNTVFGSSHRTDEILNLLAEELRLVSPPPQKERERARDGKNIGVTSDK